MWQAADKLGKRAFFDCVPDARPALPADVRRFIENIRNDAGRLPLTGEPKQLATIMRAFEQSILVARIPTALEPPRPYGSPMSIARTVGTEPPPPKQRAARRTACRPSASLGMRTPMD